MNALIKWRLKLRMQKLRAGRLQALTSALWRQYEGPRLNACLDEARNVLEASHKAVVHLKTVVHGMKWQLWCERLSGLLARWWYHSRTQRNVDISYSNPTWTTVSNESYIRAMFLASAGLTSVMRDIQVTPAAGTRRARRARSRSSSTLMEPSTSFSSGSYSLEDNWISDTSYPSTGISAQVSRPQTRMRMRQNSTGSSVSSSSRVNRKGKSTPHVVRSKKRL